MPAEGGGSVCEMASKAKKKGAVNFFGGVMAARAEPVC